MKPRITLIGGMAIAGFVLSLFLLIYILNMESRRRDEGKNDTWPPQIR